VKISAIRGKRKLAPKMKYTHPIEQVANLNKAWYNITVRYILKQYKKYTMANNVSTRYIILGLLTRQPMSGYDIKQFLKQLSWLVDSPSFGSLYPALHALLEDALATVEVIPRQDKPPRKIYTITDAGKRVLQEWLDRPVASGVSLKTFLMRLILSSNLSHAGLIAHLQRRHDQVSTHRLALEQDAQAMDQVIDLGDRLALDYGLSIATAELAWLERTLVRLSQAMPIEIVPGDVAISIAGGAQSRV